MAVAVDLFDDIPDNARLWVIAADRTLSQPEQASVSERLNSFFNRWKSHGRDVVARVSLLHDRFVVIAAYIPGSDVSGCGIDSSVKEFDSIAGAIGFDRVPVLDILYHDGQQVRSVDRATFATLADSGEVSQQTAVFDTSLSSVADWKKGLFERPVSESWHAGVFF
jgi:hypothetical protein